MNERIAIPTKPNGGNHTALFAASARTEEAHVQTLKVIKGLAHTGFRVINDDKFFNAVCIHSPFEVREGDLMCVYTGEEGVQETLTRRESHKASRV
jgi:hypothetical protein